MLCGLGVMRVEQSATGLQPNYPKHMVMGCEDLRKMLWREFGLDEDNYPERQFEFPVKEFSLFYSYDGEHFLLVIHSRE